DEPRHLAEAFGHVVSLDFYRFQPDRVAQLLHEAGLAVFARLLREPDETERVQQAYVLARKPTTIGDINDVR
ncbi:MAG: class I SAM-dependent methyltransferase, partial [Pseudonocardiaceae bacterium]